MIEFKALAIKTNTDVLHVIFLLKKNIQSDIIKMIIIEEVVFHQEKRGVEGSNYLSWTRIQVYRRMK